MDLTREGSFITLGYLHYPQALSRLMKWYKYWFQFIQLLMHCRVEDVIISVPQIQAVFMRTYWNYEVSRVDSWTAWRVIQEKLAVSPHIWGSSTPLDSAAYGSCSPVVFINEKYPHVSGPHAVETHIVQREAAVLFGSLMSSQSAAANLSYLWTWLVSFSFGFFSFLCGFKAKWEYYMWGLPEVFRVSPSYWFLDVILLRKYPMCFQHRRWPFFFLTVFLKTVIYSFYLFTFPLLFFDDENKRTCQVGHKNGMKCISKSLIILCILL